MSACGTSFSRLRPIRNGHAATYRQPLAVCRRERFARCVDALSIDDGGSGLIAPKKSTLRLENRRSIVRRAAISICDDCFGVGDFL
jgi:hypothetical protein